MDVVKKILLRVPHAIPEVGVCEPAYLMIRSTPGVGKVSQRFVLSKHQSAVLQDVQAKIDRYNQLPSHQYLFGTLIHALPQDTTSPSPP